MKIGTLLFALLLTSTPLAAQAAAIDSAAAFAARQTAAEVQHGGPSGEHEACGSYAPGDIITPHITDSHCIELPKNGWKLWEPVEHELPRWEPIHIGSFAIDISPTKHVVMLLVAATLLCIVLITAARAHGRHTHEAGRPKGFAAGIESMVLFIRQEVALPNLGHHGEKYAPFILALFFFIRQEVALPNLGHHGEKYAPFILALFFFILFANLLGLIPYGSTATGNISVTATLAIITFFVVEIAGMRAQGIGYLGTIFYWNKDLNLPIRVLMLIIMSPIEVVSKISKPGALAIRLLANMTAGHIVVLALISLIFTFKSYLIGTAPALMAVAIMMLELFVAFLQAFIFSLLASVFIGQIREAAH